MSNLKAKAYKRFEDIIVTVPKANYIAVRGKGDPNKEVAPEKWKTVIRHPIKTK